MSALEDNFDPIFEDIDKFFDEANCGFVGERYEDIKDSFCVQMV